uniref:Uncharacterized protein n=1 Tax=Meloidogyne hapla TaxID=6305 RepID=A0A1I8BPP1_MELHA
MPFPQENFPKFPQVFRMPLNGNNYFGEANNGFGQNYQLRQGFGVPQMSNNYFGQTEQLRNLLGMNEGMPQQPYFHNQFQMPPINNPQFAPPPYFQFQQRPFHDQPSTFPEGFQSGVEENKGVEQTSSSQAMPQENNQKSSIFGESKGKGETETNGQIGGSSESNSESTSLPSFLRGAQNEFIEEYKRIIREPNLPYNEQVALMDQLVKKLDLDRQVVEKGDFLEDYDR